MAIYVVCPHKYEDPRFPATPPLEDEEEIGDFPAGELWAGKGLEPVESEGVLKYKVKECTTIYVVRNNKVLYELQVVRSVEDGVDRIIFMANPRWWNNKRAFNNRNGWRQ